MLRCDQLLSGGDNGKIRDGVEITMDSIIATQQDPDGVAQIQMPISISPDHLQPASAASADRLKPPLPTPDVDEESVEHHREHTGKETKDNTKPDSDFATDGMMNSYSTAGHVDGINLALCNAGSAPAKNEDSAPLVSPTAEPGR